MVGEKLVRFFQSNTALPGALMGVQHLYFSHIIKLHLILGLWVGSDCIVSLFICLYISSVIIQFMLGTYLFHNASVVRKIGRKLALIYVSHQPPSCFFHVYMTPPQHATYGDIAYRYIKVFNCIQSIQLLGFRTTQRKFRLLTSQNAMLG